MRTDFEVIIKRADGEEFTYIYFLEEPFGGVKNLSQAIDKALQQYEEEYVSSQRGIVISATRTEKEDK